MSPDKEKELLFPFTSIRKEQDKLLLLTDASIKHKRNLLCHAPTGLGKTVAVLGPALRQSLNNGYTTFFLTSRHTQHRIAVETLKLIKRKYDVSFNAVSIIGKKWMCIQPGIEALYSSEFADYCRKLREEKKCEFYNNTKNKSKFTELSKKVFGLISSISPVATEKIIKICRQEKLCPYEISIALAANSKVIITDYYYLFNPSIGENFLAKIGKDFEDLVIIVDEAHNLPFRLKDLASEHLSTITLRRAVKEAKKFAYIEVVEILNKIQDIMLSISGEMQIESEKLVTKKEFMHPLDVSYDYEQVKQDFKFIGDTVRETQKQSYIGAVSKFLERWAQRDNGFARIISFKKGFRKPYYLLSYRCLDPSVVCSPIVKSISSSIFMSGTLVPIKMYKEVLGIEESQEVVFNDPYPKKNRLNLIIPKTTTKYKRRGESEYKKIAEITSDIVNIVPGNSAVFFPSYYLRDKVNEFFAVQCKKTTFTEDSKMNKSQRLEMLEKFKSYSSKGAVLLGVSSGSFGEGIDLPGDLLKAVIIVGLPLRKPDLETKSLIKYYDEKFNKGWDYGYLIPAFNKTLQNAGRCIRSETDKGAIIFLDERFVWRNYYRLFPKDWDIKVKSDYKKELEEFFRKYV
ncbi:hypothetical protein GF327_01935 [Candidatus Woesearchaeota archaeon]|nr:hypothetical protein [Candidatus Woesearchaeota archaeon]